MMEEGERNKVEREGYEREREREREASGSSQLVEFTDYIQ